MPLLGHTWSSHHKNFLTHQPTQHMLPKPLTNHKIGQEKKKCIKKTDHESNTYRGGKTKRA